MNYGNFRRKPWPLKVLFFICIGAIFLFGFAWIVQVLWNAILPNVSNIKPISFWQAMGILVLSKILFSSMKFGPKPHHRHKPGHWKRNWSGMSMEEKQIFKEKWKARCEQKDQRSQESE